MPPFSSSLPDQQFAKFVFNPGGGTLLERFGYGDDFSSRLPTRLEIDPEKKKLIYRFSMRSDIQNSGGSVSIQTSEDLLDWISRQTPPKEETTEGLVEVKFELEVLLLPFIRRVDSVALDE